MSGVRTNGRRAAAERGFTLVEVMIVIAIIGLIAGIVALNAGRLFGEAKADKVKADAKVIGDAILLFSKDCGGLPGGLEDLIQNPGVDNWRGPYIQGGVKAIKDPWGKPYVYEPSSGTPPYRIGSYGQDGAPGGSGEAADIFPSDEQ